MEPRFIEVHGTDIWCWRHVEVLRDAGMEGVFGATQDMILRVLLEVIDAGLDPTEAISEFGPLCCYLGQDVMDDIYTRHAILN